MMTLTPYTLIHSHNTIIISSILYQDNKSDLVFLPTYYVINIIQHNNYTTNNNVIKIKMFFILLVIIFTYQKLNLQQSFV